MSDETKKPDDEMTPLERYLAKQKGGEGQAANESSSQSNYRPPEDDPAVNAGAPAFPPPSSSRLRAEVDPEPAPVPTDLVPAEFWPRAGAFFIDGLTVSFLAAILTGVTSAAFFFLPRDFTGSWMLSRFVVIFFYYGWFYAEKGASPGKLLLGLEIREAGTGRRLGYVRTFFRETFGKMLSGIIFGMGYIIVAFRKDRCALHDMIFDTRVFRRVTVPPQV
jgi:uncharacterized RDD family membrane protein YckC